MKKMSKLVMAAILAVALQGTAMAATPSQVDLNQSPVVNGLKFATEMISTASGSTTNILTESAGGHEFNTQAKLGFGVSTGQTRFIRFELSGAQLNESLAGGLNGTTGNLLDLNATSTISSGGSAGDTFVIFQITANENLDQSKTMVLNLGSLKITDKGNPVTITYSLYEQAYQAANPNLNQGLLYSKFGNIASFATGFKFETKAGSATATVLDDYELFGGDIFAPIGTVLYDAAYDVYNANCGALALGDLVQATSSLVLTTDQTFASAKKLYISNVACDENGASAAANATIGTNTATFVVNTTELGSDGTTPTYYNLCYVANGTVEIPVQTFTMATAVTPKTGTATANLLNQPAGTILHDGTVLRAPFIQGQAGQSSFIQLANMGNQNAAYDINCFGPSGSKTQGTGSSVAAGQTKKIYMNNTGCAANTNALEFIMNVPSGNVVGSFIRQHTTSGDTAADSLTGNSNGQTSYYPHP